MKFFCLSFLFLNIAFGIGTSIESKCSNADATVQYTTKDGERKLLVTVSKKNVDGSEVYEKQEIHNFVVREVKNVLIEKSRKTNCAEIDSTQGILTVKSLNFRRVEFQKENGAEFQSKIVGLNSDKKTLLVDYICESVTKSEVTCH